MPNLNIGEENLFCYHIDFYPMLHIGSLGQPASWRLCVPVSTNEGNQLQAAGFVNASSHTGNNLGNSCAYAVSLQQFSYKKCFSWLTILGRNVDRVANQTCYLHFWIFYHNALC